MPDLESIQHQEIVTGDPNEAAPMGSLNMGGMYKRMMNETIRSYVMVHDIDEKIAMVDKLGGKILLTKKYLMTPELPILLSQIIRSELVSFKFVSSSLMDF